MLISFLHFSFDRYQDPLRGQQLTLFGCCFFAALQTAKPLEICLGSVYAKLNKCAVNIPPLLIVLCWTTILPSIKNGREIIVEGEGLFSQSNFLPYREYSFILY